ncbi:lysosome-associated membrane glycoprotein 3 isoform X2 [Erinaceus europaeus]|uniref:Lysosome-associated membrane glycoprotein 3 isoform X2 n=1 Tax=Erinaceus europaeus TaxID=9365 RepID=A0A1S3WQI2_ERIEU|nr:lysosome-associated membrane glycoprotein 3 isoform X2 [Erinaceus europaeus]
MARLLSPMAACLLSLAVILHHSHQIGAKGTADLTDPPQPTTAATVPLGGKPSLLQPRSMASPQGVTSTSSSDSLATHMAKTPATTFLVTINGTPSTSPVTQVPVTSLATASTSHTTTQVTEATIGPGVTSQATRTTPPVPTTGTNTPASNPTTGGAPQPSSSQTPLSAAVSSSTPPNTSMSGQTSAQLTHGPGPTTVPHNTTKTPSTMAPGPSLVPRPTAAKTGMYQVLNGSRLCIKAEMGVQLIVQDMELMFSSKSYFNVDPNATQASGNCDSRKANLLLNFPGGCVNLTFTKDENLYYISEVGASLIVSHPEKNYHGKKSAVVMFETVVGHSFKCVSEQSIQLSSQLQLQTVNVQLQAFDFEGAHFGNVDECSSDYTIVLPVIGAIVLGLCAVGLIIYGVRLRRESSGYQRI